MKYPVLVPNIFNHPFTYSSKLKLNVGDYVRVPFGKKLITGVVWDHFENNSKKNFQLKKIVKKIDLNPLKKETIKFLNWFSNYNLVPKGMCLKLHLLSGEAIEKLNEKEYTKYFLRKKTINFSLSKKQKLALAELIEINNKFRVHVLQGMTGSGKTIVYFKAIENLLKNKKQALIMLPEIGLTGEFEKKFFEFFGFEAAVWHSNISSKRKKIIWSGVASNDIKVVIGARSALFLPFKSLGVIVVDEEHDQSYKQDEGVIYNGRDMAVARAKFENIPINLVTAVPSVETYANIKSKKYFNSRINERYRDAKLPSYEIIDINKFKLFKQNWISSKTVEKVKSHLEKGDQVLFFINRRGFAPYVMCKKCFEVFSCPNCSINLVYHKNKKYLLCHYCGFQSSLFRKCKINENCDFIFSGPGVEKIAEEAKRLFSEKKILIFSSDTMNRASSKKDIEKIINGEVNILVGTQLISKGFHFPNLNCIVVLDFDLTSQGHDLRGPEKNLQLYHQLSGRAGRTGKPAIIYFQTYQLNFDYIKKITNEDPFIFLENELKIRKSNSLPPFERFIAIIMTSKNEKALDKFSNKFKKFLSEKLKEKILGPVNAPVYKIKKNFRHRILIRSSKNSKIQSKLEELLKDFKFHPGIKLTVDVDPVNFN